MHAHRRVQVSILGSLRVVRPDGTVVPVEDFRTGKTMDLLRLLALSNGRAVRPGDLIARLWPDVIPERASSSLRTASWHIRQAVGSNCVAREVEGLVLVDAYVDVDDFRGVAREALAAASAGHHPRVLAFADLATALYRGDFRAHADDSTWARAARDELRLLRLDVLNHAAESALELGQARTGLRFAQLAVRTDPVSDVAQYRLMQAQVAVGELPRALRTFAAYRHRLAEELGVDPSPQLQELHLRILRGTLA